MNVIRFYKKKIIQTHRADNEDRHHHSPHLALFMSSPPPPRKRARKAQEKPRCAESPVQCWALARHMRHLPLFEPEVIGLVLDLANHSVPVVPAPEISHRNETLWLVDWTAATPRWVTRAGELELLQRVSKQPPLRYHLLLQRHTCFICDVRNSELPDVYPVICARRVPFECCYSCGLWICLECMPKQLPGERWCCSWCEHIPFAYCEVCGLRMRNAIMRYHCERCALAFCNVHMSAHLCGGGGPRGCVIL